MFRSLESKTSSKLDVSADRDQIIHEIINRHQAAFNYLIEASIYLYLKKFK